MIDFIIPAYGESKHLKHCIESLLSQSVPSAISIATSTPSVFLEKIAKKYEIPVFINSRNEGIAADWNFALSIGSRKIRVLAHQDDLYEPNFAEKVILFHKTYPDAGIFFTDAIEVEGKSNLIKFKREFVKKLLRKNAFFLNKKIINSNFSTFLLLGFGCPIPCPSVIYNWNLVSEINFSKAYSVNLDWDFWCKVAAARIPIGYLRGNLVVHRIHADAETQVAIKERRRHDEDREIFLRFWPSSVVNFLMFFYRLGY